MKKVKQFLRYLLIGTFVLVGLYFTFSTLREFSCSELSENDKIHAFIEGFNQDTIVSSESVYDYIETPRFSRWFEPQLMQNGKIITGGQIGRFEQLPIEIEYVKKHDLMDQVKNIRLIRFYPKEESDTTLGNIDWYFFVKPCGLRLSPHYSVKFNNVEFEYSDW